MYVCMFMQECVCQLLQVQAVNRRRSNNLTNSQDSEFMACRGINGMKCSI